MVPNGLLGLEHSRLQHAIIQMHLLLGSLLKQRVNEGQLASDMIVPADDRVFTAGDCTMSIPSIIKSAASPILLCNSCSSTALFPLPSTLLYLLPFHLIRQSRIETFLSYSQMESTTIAVDMDASEFVACDLQLAFILSLQKLFLGTC